MGGGGGCCVGNLCCIANCCVGQVIRDTIKKIFGGSSGSSSGGRTESYDRDTSTLEETIKVQNALSEFKSDTQGRSAKLENDIVKESRESLDAFIADLRKYNKIKYGNRRLNVNISNIERENRKTEDKIHGFIIKRVSKRISLDDSECIEILKMDAGKEKETALDNFYKKVLKEAISELSDELSSNIETQSDNICDKIQQRIDNIVDICEAKTVEFESISKVKESDEDNMEQEQIRLTNIVALCDLALELAEKS
ncbi:MAG: hypothetical protein IKK91_00200 [Ruminococcus sp.]|nr:hypothetical protein [Ruminococcus sp.]